MAERRGPTNWFENNPKKTIFVFLILILLALGYGAEKILAYKNHGVGFNFALPNRAIRLSEYRPSMTISTYPEKAFRASNSLVLKHYLLRTDQDGFIIPSKKYDNPDISLAFLGASTTECHYMSEENRFPNLVGVLLEKELGIKINSYNAARAGNNSLHSLDIFLNKVIPVNPKIVIMLHNINDLSTLLYEKTYWNKNAYRSAIIDMNKEILSNSFKIMRDKYIPNLAGAMRNFAGRVRSWWNSGRQSQQPQEDEFASSRGKKIVINEDQLVSQFQMNLQTFINICRARNITPVLMTMANRFTDTPNKIIASAIPRRKNNGIGYRKFKALFDSFNEAIRRKASENNILLIDLAREIPPEKEYLSDLVHYNENGSIQAAKLISQRLLPIVRQAVNGK